MSRRVLSGVKCNFCTSECYKIEGDTGLYCYGCRERKDLDGYGHKDDLAGGLRLGEKPSDLTPEALAKRKEARDAAVARRAKPESPGGAVPDR